MNARQQRFMRRAAVCLVGSCLALTACSSSGTGSLPVIDHTQVYRDSSGWSIKVPPGWHARQFNDTKDGITSRGVQLSNVRLPLPSLVPGYPVQVNGQVLPGDGIGLIIATGRQAAARTNPEAASSRAGRAQELLEYRKLARPCAISRNIVVPGTRNAPHRLREDRPAIHKPRP